MNNLTNRWLSVLGISTVCFGIFLFVLRVPARTISIFFVIGIPLVLLWLYVDEKSKEQKKTENTINMKQRLCICSICKHEQAAICFEHECACCLTMKGDKIVGHSINPMQ